ncbi:MAG: hypothetical protein WA765_08585 [Candidatus Acidiferrum sp.]
MAEPLRLKQFCISGVGVKTILKQIGYAGDFPGCYVLSRSDLPFYVGISRGVVGRLRQHVIGRTHFDASLAYLMACGKVTHNMKRAEAMKNDPFRRAFDEAQRLLRDSAVAFIEISNPLELYLFEAYCAMELNTGEWNTFRTH